MKCVAAHAARPFILDLWELHPALNKDLNHCVTVLNRTWSSVVPSSQRPRVPSPMARCSWQLRLMDVALGLGFKAGDMRSLSRSSGMEWERAAWGVRGG